LFRIEKNWEADLHLTAPKTTWEEMSGQIAKKYPLAGMQAAATVSAHMLKVARPLFWHIGVPNEGPLRGASTFIIQFETRYVAVTADHVIAQYLEAREADHRTICQIGECRVWPEASLIARSSKLDIATFQIDAEKLSEMGAVPFDCRPDWPPPEVKEGDSLTLAGYLDTRRNKIGRGYYEHEAWGANAIADAVSPREIVTVYDPEVAFAADDGVTKPPLRLNMSGCSGGPAIVLKAVNGLIRWFPAGFIYKGPGDKAEGEFATFDRIHIRKLHFIQPDGTIAEPDTGWLPT
jgi:hypothetical protein